MGQLSPSEKLVGHAILDGKIDPFTDSITQAARKVSVSASLVNKFCYKIGASGWKELKAISIASLSRGLSDVKEENRVIDQITLVINSMISNPKYIKIAENISKRIMKAKRTIVFSNEYTSLITRTFVYKLNKLNINIQNLSFEMSSFAVDPEDHVIFVSISGFQSKIGELIKTLPEENEFSLITLGTSNERKITQKLAFDIFKYLKKEEKSFPMSSDVGLLIALNLIFSTVLKNFEKEKWYSQIKLYKPEF